MEEVLALIQRALDVRRVAKKQKEASAGEVPPPEGIRPHDDPHEAL
jgi:hypothetical protein